MLLYIVDLIHDIGRLGLIEPLSMAAAAAGVDGLRIEVHNKFEAALCDADQALMPDMFAGIMQRLGPLKTFLPQTPPVR